MKTKGTLSLGLVVLALAAFLGQTGKGAAAEKPPNIVGFQYPEQGSMEIIFHGTTGPFRIQMRTSVEASAAWSDVPDALVIELEPGVFMGLIPKGKADLAFYRVVSDSDGITELKGWTILANVSAPANGSYFVKGESPVVTVTILDNFAQGLSRADLSTLNLYLYGPQDPQQTVTAVKLLNASTDRSKNPHHYIDLKTNPDVKINGTTLTYLLRPVTDEQPGTYTVSVWSVLASDAIQQIMKFADLQIGAGTVENPVVAKRAVDGTPKCAACHEGAISGKIYMHHIDPIPLNSPYIPDSTDPHGLTGHWSLDFVPVKTCKSCHNNEGYAAYPVVTLTSTNRVPDPIVRRVHGVHNGAHLKLPFNTNSVDGSFKNYVHVEFPADIEGRPLVCTKCHLDDRWKTETSRLACGSCHDNVWFGPTAQTPADMVAHKGEPAEDSDCKVCHKADSGLSPVSVRHMVSRPSTNAIDVTMTRPANGTNYVAGERPVVTLVFKNDAGNSIGDHTVVNTTNFSTASLFVYGPRSHTLPVLTSLAKYGVDTKRASVTCATNGPWAINGKTFKIGINGTAPQDIKIVGASNLVTAAEVVASLNTVITNLNGGAKASVSGSRVIIRSLIRGAAARIEIYNGEVTTAMGWKAKGVVLEPDVFVAAVSTAGNDLRPVTDPLDYTDPMVTRTTTNITYRLDDVAGLTPGTYGIYVYYLPVANKIAGITNLTGIGHMMFQVGTATPEKKVATNCTDCHGDTIWHLAEGPIHAEPFDTDYCKACHDYSHPNTGDMFKNQGGTSLNGWSGFGAMPIVRRVHGVHRGNYLEHPEQIYANATVDTFGHIIFPQDIRNCTKCHAETDTWKQKPSRMACLACHDSDEAKAHAKIMTFIPDPNDPYGPTSLETCVICHGAGTEFSPDKVHRIANPYEPPYPREPRE